jgi:hypothetical protein
VHSIQGHSRNAREAAFLPGGIGTGNVPTGARGESRDCEIVKGPCRGKYVPSAFSGLRASGHHAPSVSRVLESVLAGDSGEPDPLESPGETLARREYRLPRSLAEVNMSSMARRS